MFVCNCMDFQFTWAWNTTLFTNCCIFLLFPSLVPWSVGWGRPQRKESGVSTEWVRGREERQGGERQGVWTRLLTDQWEERLHSHLEIHELWDFHWFRTCPGPLPAAADLPAPQELQRRLAHFPPVSPLVCTVQERWTSSSIVCFVTTNWTFGVKHETVFPHCSKWDTFI